MALDTVVSEAWWNPISLSSDGAEDGGCWVWQMGRRSLWLRRLGLDLAWATRVEDEELPHALVGSLAQVPPEIEEWPRWIVDSAQHQIRVVPVLPGLPVVIRPYQPISVAPRLSVRIFVGLPCVMRLELLGSAGTVSQSLAEEPSVPLSQTWFGEPTYGELGLSLRSRARRNLHDIDHLPHRILCPVQIHNRHSGPFAIERAFVRLAHCGVYHGADRLFSSAIHLTYRGPEHEVEMEVENHPPTEAPAATLLQAPRQPSGAKGARGVLAGLRSAWMSP